MIKKIILLLLVIAVVILTTGSQRSPKSSIVVQVRLTISTPDGHFYNLASDSSRLGSTGTSYRNILLSEAQMTSLSHLVRTQLPLTWVDMTAESPYPKSNTVLLWYGSATSGSDSVMCSLGAARDAMPVLQKIAACIPQASKQEFLKSLERIKETQPSVPDYRRQGAPQPEP